MCTLIPKLYQREFAFRYVIEGEEVMSRHRSFQTHDEVMDYYNDDYHVQGVFCSAAYYEYPDAIRMKDKVWLGSDLAIDLDTGMDHRMNKSKFMARRTYDLLRKMFGLRKLQIVFSGNRGFHIYARDKSVRQLSCHHRGEIADCLEIKGPIDLDRGVIVDVKRLMRYPDSYHPKTGYLVRFVSIDELEEFVP